jgi:hypothetical protein
MASLPSAPVPATAVSGRRSVAAHARPKSVRRTSARRSTEAANALAEMLVGDAVSYVLALDGRSLRRLHEETGLDPAFLSRLASGKNCTVSSLARLALALGKQLHITIE